MVQQLSLEELGIKKSDSFKKDKAFQKLEYILENSRTLCPESVLQILFYFFKFNPEQQQTFETQRKIVDFISDFYLLDQGVPVQKSKMEEKKFFVCLKDFFPNYFLMVERKAKRKLWLYCVTKLLIMRDQNQKQGLQTMCLLMNFLAIELEEEFIKKDINLEYLMENLIVNNLTDHYTKQAIWSLFLEICLKSKKQSFKMLSICLSQLNSCDLQPSKLPQNDEFYLGQLSLIYQEAERHEFFDEFDEKMRVQLEKFQLILSQQEDKNIELEHGFFSKVFVYFDCLLKT